MCGQLYTVILLIFEYMYYICGGIKGFRLGVYYHMYTDGNTTQIIALADWFDKRQEFFVDVSLNIILTFIRTLNINK